MLNIHIPVNCVTDHYLIVRTKLLRNELSVTYMKVKVIRGKLF